MVSLSSGPSLTLLGRHPAPSCRFLLHLVKRCLPAHTLPSLPPLVLYLGDVAGEPTFHLGDKAKAALEIRADGMEAPAELGIAAVFVGPTGVITNVQLVAALRHGRDTQV